MITKPKIKIYNKYGGSSDGFERCASKSERILFDNDDWATIDSIVQDIEMVKKGLCSADYKNKFYVFLNSNFDKDAIIILREKYAF
jgi:hypothetical protein